MLNFPDENRQVFFPRDVRVGALNLAPLTIAGAVALDALGVDVYSPATPESALVAAAVLERGADLDRVLAGDFDARRIKRLVRGRIGELADAETRIFAAAFATYLKPPKSSGGVVRPTPHGLGWPLELAAQLATAFGWTFETCGAMGVARAWALVAAHRQLDGGGHGTFDYVEREYIRNRKRSRSNGR